MDQEVSDVLEQLECDRTRERVQRYVACLHCGLAFQAEYPEGTAFLTCPRCSCDVSTD